MTRGRLPLLVVVVGALVAVVALVAHGRPLAASAGRAGLPTAFWDLVLTSVLILVVLFILAIVWTLLEGRNVDGRPPAVSNTRLLRYFVGVLVLAIIVVALRNHLNFHFHHPHKNQNGAKPGSHIRVHRLKRPTGQTHLHVVWEEVVAVAGLILVAVAVFWARLNRSTMGDLPLLTAPEAIAAALDESLDDLRTDPDLRRAIVAAYARMERALAAIGVRRRPSEAPLEYLERALHELDTSGSSIRRLTDLFEWAKFSHHEPEPSMRDDAVDALEVVRDELRATVRVAAPVRVVVA